MAVFIVASGELIGEATAPLQPSLHVESLGDPSDCSREIVDVALRQC